MTLFLLGSSTMRQTFTGRVYERGWLYDGQKAEKNIKGLETRKALQRHTPLPSRTFSHGPILGQSIDEVMFSYKPSMHETSWWVGMERATDTLIITPLYEMPKEVKICRNRKVVTQDWENPYFVDIECLCYKIRQF